MPSPTNLKSVTVQTASAKPEAQAQFGHEPEDRARDVDEGGPRKDDDGLDEFAVHFEQHDVVAWRRSERNSACRGTVRARRPGSVLADALVQRLQVMCSPSCPSGTGYFRTSSSSTQNAGSNPSFSS